MPDLMYDVSSRPGIGRASEAGAWETLGLRNTAVRLQILKCIEH